MSLALSRLFRPRLALLNAVTAAGGYLLFPAETNYVTVCGLFFGVLLLAAAASALNQALEQDLDSVMQRTMARPLPRGDLTVRTVTVCGGVAALAGGALLALYAGNLSMILGAASLLWYLAVYTPLKRRSSAALAVGAICGALTPLIGWCAAGGKLLDFRIMFLAGLLYLWQIPHFWLLQRRHADDYRRAGLPLVAVGNEGSRVSGLLRLWIVALATGTMLLPAFALVPPRASFWYLAFPLSLIMLFLLRSEKTLFSYLNLFPLLVTLTLFLY